jgi:hypothetical protein
MSEEINDAAPSSTEPILVAVPAENPDVPPLADVPNVVLAAESHTEEQASVTSAAGENISSHNVGNSPAELTFEQRVEQRFIALEQALMRLPHSLHTVLSRGSTTAEEFAHNVLAHLFGHNQ